MSGLKLPDSAIPSWGVHLSDKDFIAVIKDTIKDKKSRVEAAESCKSDENVDQSNNWFFCCSKFVNLKYSYSVCQIMSKLFFEIHRYSQVYDFFVSRNRCNATTIFLRLFWHSRSWREWSRVFSGNVTIQLIKHNIGILKLWPKTARIT